MGKVRNSIKKEFDSDPVHNEKYAKAKIKFHVGKINTNKFLVILLEKVLMKKNLMKKILRKKTKYTMCLFLYLKYKL